MRTELPSYRNAEAPPLAVSHPGGVGTRLDGKATRSRKGEAHEKDSEAHPPAARNPEASDRWHARRGARRLAREHQLHQLPESADLPRLLSPSACPEGRTQCL